ncbi:MAG: sugar phosphate isomerase/epimerase [Victivallaceae bacterium]
MSDNLTAISTTVFGEENAQGSLLQFLDIIQQAGFSSIELSRKQRDIACRAKQIKETGLKVWAIHGILGNSAASSDRNVRRSAVAEEIARMEDTAVFAPCPYVVHYLDRFNNPVYGENFRRSIEDIYACSSRLGFDLTIETAPYKPQYNERYPDSFEIAGFVRSFNTCDLNMTIDINHSNLNEDLEKVCENCRGLISNVHISDNHGTWEDHLPPGEGIIDLRKTFTALRNNGYTGPWNIEIHLPEKPNIETLRNIRLRVEETLA